LDIDHGGKKACEFMGKAVNCNVKARPESIPWFSPKKMAVRNGRNRGRAEVLSLSEKRPDFPKRSNQESAGENRLGNSGN
jgi:hypothetical protein